MNRTRYVKAFPVVEERGERWEVWEIALSDARMVCPVARGFVTEFGALSWAVTRGFVVPSERART